MNRLSIPEGSSREWRPGHWATSACRPDPFPLVLATMVLKPLSRDDAMRRIAASEGDIRALGVERLALFGSVARDQALPDSDVDVLVQFAPGAKTFERFFTLAELLEEQLGRPVELVTTESLSPFLGPHILAEAVDVVRAA